MTRDDRRDDAVRRRLQSERPLPLSAAADWERLAQRITAGAEPLLAARSAVPAPRQRPGGFSRMGLPLALAAGIALLVFLTRLDSTTPDPTAATSAFLAALAGETSQETVLDATLGQPSETWLLAEGR
jgi:hypothetical protein